MSEWDELGGATRGDTELSIEEISEILGAEEGDESGGRFLVEGVLTAVGGPRLRVA